jgi:hypothetical protein
MQELLTYVAPELLFRLLQGEQESGAHAVHWRVPSSCKSYRGLHAWRPGGMLGWHLRTMLHLMSQQIVFLYVLACIEMWDWQRRSNLVVRTTKDATISLNHPRPLKKHAQAQPLRMRRCS